MAGVAQDRVHDEVASDYRHEVSSVNAVVAAVNTPLTPLQILSLQRTAGNRLTRSYITSGGSRQPWHSARASAPRGFGVDHPAGASPLHGSTAERRQLQRLRDPQPEGSPGSRPVLMPGDTGPGVKLLQRLLGLVPPSGVYDDFTHTAVTDFQTKAFLPSGNADSATWAALEERQMVKGEAVPTTKSFDDLSAEHKARVVAVVNRHFDVAYRWHGTNPSQGPRTVRRVLMTARNTVSAERNEGTSSVNITLRDAQRYLYGRLAPYTDAHKLRSWGEGGDDEGVFTNDPSQQNIRGTILVTEEYETVKASGTDVKTTANPASALGGIPFFNKGIADSSMDLASDKWKQDVMPQYMDATDIGEHCVAEGQGAFPNCSGGDSSEEA